VRGTAAEYEIRPAVLESCRSEELIRTAQRIGVESHCCIVCLDADYLAGIRHVESAVCHAMRAWREETAIADSLEMEVLLYAGGTRQTNVGRHFGVRPDTRNLYLCFIPASVEAVTGMEHCVRYTEDPCLELTEERLQRLATLFGISRAECDAVGRNRFPDLVIERVALLDVLK
jgi:KEOPS complex subunit Cgi121